MTVFLINAVKLYVFAPKLHSFTGVRNPIFSNIANELGTDTHYHARSAIIPMPFAEKFPILSFKNAFLGICLLFLSFYPIYANYYRGLAVEHYNRHKNLIAGKSWFFNPWQYRILCPFMVEGMYQLYQASVDRVFHLEQYVKPAPVGDSSGKNEKTQQLLADMQNPDFIKYTAIFVLFRALEHLAIFYLALLYYRQFVHNRWLLFFALGFISIAMGNSVSDSDLTFNTYMDVIMYLSAGYIILAGKPIWRIVPLTIVAAFNRETCLFIPALLFVANIDFSNFYSLADWRTIKLPRAEVWVVTAVSLVFFAMIFVGIRLYYGYQPPTVWRVPAGLPMLKLNLLSSISIKTYFEMFGTFALLPFVFLFKFRAMDFRLRLFFLLMVPLWLLVHWVSVVGYQSRLYLVPTLLILLPGVLQLIERSIRREALAGQLPAA